MKTIIFDFDGTIADTFPFVYDIINNLASKYGIKKLSRNELEDLRTMSMKDIVEKYNLNRLKLLRIMADAHKAIAEKVPETKIFEGVPKVLNSLKAQGYRIAIISSNSRQNIMSILIRNDIDIFDVVDTSMSLFGKGKKLIKIMNKGNFNKDNTLYIGDEVRDIEAAHNANIKIISVGWGYNTSKILKENNSIVVSSPEKLLEAIENSFK